MIKKHDKKTLALIKKYKKLLNEFTEARCNLSSAWNKPIMTVDGSVISLANFGYTLPELEEMGIPLKEVSHALKECVDEKLYELDLYKKKVQHKIDSLESKLIKSR